MPINLTLTIAEINFIINTLAKLPYEHSAELINEIKAQATPQVEAINKGVPNEQ